MKQTIRQTIVEMLKHKQLSARDLSEILDSKETEIIDHLEHIVRSVRPLNRLTVKPARCKQCGFQFNKRNRIKSPSRCPQCKSELIERPRFFIV